MPRKKSVIRDKRGRYISPSLQRYGDVKTDDFQIVYAYSCKHVYNFKPIANQFSPHFFVRVNDNNVVFQHEWKYCPVCGREVFWLGECK